MGKSTTPKYIVETRDNSHWHSTPMAWQMKQYGKPTVKNLEKFMANLNESFNVGGVNFPSSKAAGFIVYHHAARIINQKTGDNVASWSAPSFQVM